MALPVTTPPWLEELKKKKQIKLQKNSSVESIVKNPNEENNAHDQVQVAPSAKPVPTSTTTPEESQEETSWGVHHLKKKKNSTIDENPVNKIGTGRVMTNTILVVNNSTKNTSSNIVSPPTKTPPPIPSTAPPSIFTTENFVPTENDEYLDEFDDDAEIMEVMSPVNLDKKLSVREMETDMGTVMSRPSISDGEIVFDEVSSITLVKPLTRSESLNRHNLRTYGHNGPGSLMYKPKSSENVSSDSYGIEQKALKSETKLKFLRIIEQMERIVNKNAIENQSIKKELEAVIEENKLLSKNLDILKAEIDRL
ncbi:uncharacterized protein LOC108732265 isoform X2 [Agrilus planipennis]|nr:uncharacterized protein LOC108732265 isoform X2 [Agrilus planipennis]